MAGTRTLGRRRRRRDRGRGAGTDARAAAERLTALVDASQRRGPRRAPGETVLTVTITRRPVDVDVTRGRFSVLVALELGRNVIGAAAYDYETDEVDCRDRADGCGERIARERDNSLSQPAAASPGSIR